MRAFSTILLCLHLATSSGILLPDIAFLAYDVITLGINFIDRLTSGETVQESINNLQTSVNELHHQLQYTTQLVELLIELTKEQPYKLALSQHIEQIKSCKVDLDNVLQQPNSKAALENFKKCNIIGNVRAIGGYLSGHAVVGSPPFFELYRHKGGYYKGLAIKTMFHYLYSYFIDGCTVVVAAERIAFGKSSKIYRDECWKTVEDINSYMKDFYRKCITASCPWFYSQARELLNKPEIVNISSANDALQNNFPWYQFLVVATDSTVTNNGTFALQTDTFTAKRTYQVFWTDSFVSFTKSNTNENQTFISIPILICDYEGSSYGMNLSKLIYLEEKLFSFIGYTSNKTMNTCIYEHVSDESSPVSSPQKLTMVCMFIFVVLKTFFFV